MNSVSADEITSSPDKDNFFSSSKIEYLDKLLDVDFAREWNGMDRLVIAKGSFSQADKEKLSQILLTQGFEVVDGMSFIGGSGEEWQQVEGSVEAETDFERENPQTDQLKLLYMGDGKGVFLFQSTGF